MEQRVPASALVFLRGEGLPAREEVEAALEDLGGDRIWRGENERGPDLVVRVDVDHRVAINLVGAPAPAETFADHLKGSGIEESDQQAILIHGSHV